MAGARGTGLALAADGGRIILRIGEPGGLVGAFVIIDAQQETYCQVTTRPSFSPNRSG
jgi:hypothetical protein